MGIGNPTNIPLNFDAIRPFLILLGSLLAGWTVYLVVGSLKLGGRSAGSLVAGYVGEEEPPGLAEKLGMRMLRLPVVSSWLNVNGSIRWLRLTGENPSPERIAGEAALYASLGVILFLFTGTPVALLLSLVAGAYPVVSLNSRADSVRKRVKRELPDMAALLAAEMAANNPPDKALERASEWGGPLAAIVREAVAASRSSGKPLFGRGSTAGTLVETARKYDLPQLHAFVSQIDLAARKGVAGPELMERLSRALILEFKEESLREAEALDNKLVVPSVLFFFVPFLFMVMAPLVFPLLGLL